MEKEWGQAREFLRQKQIPQSAHQLVGMMKREGNSMTKEGRGGSAGTVVLSEQDGIECATQGKGCLRSGLAMSGGTQSITWGTDRWAH